MIYENKELNTQTKATILLHKPTLHYQRIRISYQNPICNAVITSSNRNSKASKNSILRAIIGIVGSGEVIGKTGKLETR